MNTKIMCFYKAIMQYLPFIAVLFLCACSAINSEDISQDTGTRNGVLNIISSGSSSEIQENMETWSSISEEEATTPDSSSTSGKDEDVFGMEDSLSLLDSSTGMNSISELSTSSDKEAEKDVSSIMMKYRSILQGESTFFSIVAEENINLNQLSLAVASDDSDMVNVSQFAVLDLDGDGTEELVLQLKVYDDDGYAFVILHHQDDVIYGHTIWRRGFSYLKADGSFFFSSGAADNGWGTLQFDGEILTIIEKARSCSYYDDDNNFFIEYFVDGTSVTEGGFTSAEYAFWAKPNVTWFDFVSDNLDEILK